jgi:glutamine synthetase
MFDGSSIAGWKSIEESDMKLMPDTDSAYIDPFYAEKTMCCIARWSSPTPANPTSATRAAPPKRPRPISSPPASATWPTSARKPSSSSSTTCASRSRRTRCPTRSTPRRCLEHRHRIRDGQHGPPPGHKGGYFPVNPVDDSQDIRSEMLSTMAQIGMKVDKHHHEVALPARARPDLRRADQPGRPAAEVQVRHPQRGAGLRQVGHLHAQADQGRQRHRHARANMSIWKDGKPLFAGDKYADLSESAVLHRRHSEARQTLNAFTNPSTNSYKRLIPGFEAPVLRAYSARNRSGCVRIPWTSKARRPSASRPASPTRRRTPTWLLGTADGRPRRDQEQDPPGRAMDKNLYDLPPEELKASRRSAARCAKRSKPREADHDFLLKPATSSPRTRSRAISS